MSSTFDRAFAIVVGEEGGYVNNSADPGGETKYGISKRSYPHIDIHSLTLDQAKEIYRTDYWGVVRGDELPPPLALLTFDAAVTSGPDQASRWLQTAVGAKADGAIGPATLAAAKAVSLASAIVSYQSHRLLFMASLETWGTFGSGWSHRVMTLLLGTVAFEQPTLPPPPALDQTITLPAIEAVFRKVLTEKAAAA